MDWLYIAFNDWESHSTPCMFNLYCIDYALVTAIHRRMVFRALLYWQLLAGTNSRHSSKAAKQADAKHGFATGS